MTIGNEWEAEMKMAIENGEDAVEKMFQQYIYDRMKKKNLHGVAEILAQETNLEISQMARREENLLTEWWQLFWPTFYSRLSNKAGANAQSSGQQSMVNAEAMLASSMKNLGASSSRQAHNDPQHEVHPVIATTGMSQQYLSAPGIHQRRTGKLPMDTSSDSVLGQSAAEPLLGAEAFGNERLGFAPVELLPGQALVGDNMFYTMPPVGSHSLQLPATMETPVRVTEDPKDYGLGWSDEMELTRRVGPNSTSTIVANHAGEANSNNQLPPTGILGAVPGPDLLSYESRVPDTFLPFMRQATNAYRRF